jgi:hypothetical protein
MFSNEICTSSAEMTTPHTKSFSLYESFYQKGESIVLSFFGRLDNVQNIKYLKDFKKRNSYD